MAIKGSEDRIGWIYNEVRGLFKVRFLRIAALLTHKRVRLDLRDTRQGKGEGQSQL